MDLKILNNNFVLIFRENIVSSLSTEAVEAKIKALFSSSSPNPILTKFPDQVMFFVPEIQMSVVVTKAAMIVTDQRVSSPSRRDALELVRFVDGLVKLINKPVTAYGFNFIAEIEGDFIGLASTFKNELLNQDNLPDLAGAELSYVLPQFSLIRGEAKLTIKFEPVLEDNAKEADKLRFNINVHYNLNGTFPEIEPLRNQYEDQQNYVSTFINKFYEPHPEQPTEPVQPAAPVQPTGPAL